MWWLIRDGEKRGEGWKGEWFVHTLQRTKTEEAVDHRQNNNYVKAVGTSPVWSNLSTLLTAISTAVRIRVTKTTSVAQLLMNNWSKRLSNFLSPAPPPCSWSLLGSLEGPAPPPSSWSHLDPQMIVQLFMRVQLTSLLLILPGLCPAEACQLRQELYSVTSNLTPGSHDEGWNYDTHQITNKSEGEWTGTVKIRKPEFCQ